MKALFVTTPPNDVANVIGAWDLWNEPSLRIIFDSNHAINETDILSRASSYNPDVVFYIGGCGGEHMLSIETLLSLKEMAPSVNMVFDGGDIPWHGLIEEYRQRKCFNLQVTIDGCLDAPVDHVTTAPVDTRLFEGIGPERDIFCGISGNLGIGDKRSTIVLPLVDFNIIQMRRRDVKGDGFADHVAYMRRCQMIINTSFTGSGNTHHVKQRVFETGFAGAALLEHASAPTSHWIPPELFFTYRTTRDARELIVSRPEVADKAAGFQAYVREHYTPQKVYGGILDRL